MMPVRERGQTTRAEHDLLELPVTILIVEDDDALRCLLERLLSAEGYQIVTADSLQAAQAAREEHGLASFSLVITDLNLSSSRQAHEGYRLYQHWSAIEPTLPFLLLSANEASHTLPAVQSGALPLIPKPFSIKSLLDTIRHLVAASTRHVSSCQKD